MAERGTYWQPAILSRLALDRHAVIEAAAGTGKTFTIAYLAAALLLGGTPLERILTVTFTEKATVELRERIRELVLKLWQGAERPDGDDSVAKPLSEDEHARLYDALLSFERAPIFTIHGFCQRVLSEFAFYCAVGFDLKVADGRSAFHRAFRAALREQLAPSEHSSALLERWLRSRSEELAKSAQAVDSLEQLLYEAHKCRYVPEPNRSSASFERTIIDVFLPLVSAQLDADKRQEGLVDYDDMLEWIWRALDGPHGAALTAALRERYRYALVDEFQDTDELQWRILRRVFVEGTAGNVIFLVGDPKQAIYRFRGADIFAYLSARDELTREHPPLSLTHNYRSTADLIAALNYVFDPLIPDPLLSGAIGYGAPAICAHPERVLRDKDATAPPVVMIRLEPHQGEKLSARKARAAIGRKIAALLHDLLNSGARLAISDSDGTSRPVTACDVMVLTRTRAESEHIASFLRAAGVPFAFYKQEGLFGGAEAGYVRDILRAIQQPDDRTARLRAWGSPFFGVEMSKLAGLDETPPDHPLIERLYRWRALAEAERFVQLANALLYESGLADRLLFAADGERALTIYEQIFDLLTAQAIPGRLSLEEIIELLSDYIAGRAIPPGEDRDTKRTPGDHEAVQIMTVHAAKGLEASVVVLYGGIHHSAQSEEVAVYHQDGQRRFAVSDEIKQQQAKTRLGQEEDEEDRRLLYVALTRARARLYLPLFPAGTLKKKPNGFYAPLNRRLLTVTKELVADGPRRQELARLFTVEPAGQDEPPIDVNFASLLGSWSPPPYLLSGEAELEPRERFASLARSRAPMAMRSYTRLRAFAEPDEWELSADDFTGDVQAQAESDDLPGGRAVGIMLHEILERVEIKTLRAAPDLPSWAAREEIIRLVGEVMRRHSVRDRRWLTRAPELVYAALTSPLAYQDGRIGPLCNLRVVRETEFVYPIPERFHPLLGEAVGEDRWEAERGYFKGFVDLVFESRGRIFFADWKSDSLRSYEPAALSHQVQLHYRLQEAIYTVGMMRWLGIRDAADYEARFGGLFYLFLRGLGKGRDASHGVYFHRPRWEEVCRYETELIGLAAVAHPEPS